MENLCSFFPWPRCSLVVLINVVWTMAVNMCARVGSRFAHSMLKAAHH